ncbi:MAG TPA: class I SAM-dependent methyltransferase [Anaerolineae bacterium]|nr:class I SAM-dependent methyltransferase [Anaerolineae bacterium]
MSKRTVFDYQAYAGHTKHLGGMAATEELVDLCEISSDDEVLEVGCGVGQTAVWLARRIGCRVIGVDNLQGMVERARERAERAGVEERVEFRVANIIDLPFEDDRFDAVFGESITVFATDHAKAIKEYARVVKPGGLVGLNESTWLQPPSPELIAWLSQDMAANATAHTAEEWEGLLESAGLQDLVVRISKVDTRKEVLGLFRRYGCGGFLQIIGRALTLYLRNPEYRNFVRETREGGIIPENTQDYLGYGLYIGRKP